jgi:hypothetical protein
MQVGAPVQPAVVQPAQPVQTVQVAQPAYPAQQPVYVVQPGYGYAYQRNYPRRPIPYNGGPVPPGATVEDRPNIALIATGGAIFGASWLFSVFAATIGDAGCGSGCVNRAHDWLYLPAIGPFLTAATMSSTLSGLIPLLVFDGLVQSGGLTLLIIGVATHRRMLVYPGYGSTQTHSRLAQWSLAPGAPGAPAGLSFSLTHF